MKPAATISVFCGSDVARGSPEYALAERVGRVLGERGYAVATGGYGGAMEAVSRGAAGAGAEVNGVTCRIWSSTPNAFVTRVIETEDYYHRLRTLVDAGGAGYVALPGGTGTLVELALVWELAAKDKRRRRPIVCVGELWRPVRDAVGARLAGAGELITFVPDAAGLRRHFPPLG